MQQFTACEGCQQTAGIEQLNRTFEAVLPRVETAVTGLLDIYTDFVEFRAAKEASGTLTIDERARLDQSAATLSEKANKALPEFSLLGIEVDEAVICANAIECTSKLATECPRINAAVGILQPLFKHLRELNTNTQIGTL